MSPEKNSKITRFFPVLVVAALVVAAVAAGFFFLGGPARGNPLVCEVKPARFIETLEVPGEMDTEKSVDVRAPTAPYERQLTWLIPEGTKVKQGDLLAEFDTADARSHLEDGQDRVTSLGQLLETETINWDIDLTTEGVRRDQKAETQQNARSRKDMSVLQPPLPREVSERTSGVADLNLAQSERRITQLQKMSAYELRRRQNHIKYRQGRVDRDASFINEYVVRSPVDSVVLYPPIPLAGGIIRKVESGDYLEREQAFLRLPDFSSRILRLRVPEHAVEKIAPDAVLDFHANAYPGRSFKARVTSISNLAVSPPSRPYQKYFEIEAEIEPGEGVEDLKPGMVVSALFTLRDHGEVLAIPRDLTFKNEEGMMAVSVESGTGVRNLPIPGDITETEDLLLVPPAKFEGGVKCLKIVFRGKAVD
jgi:HlyD family secretion protein